MQWKVMQRRNSLQPWLTNRHHDTANSEIGTTLGIVPTRRCGAGAGLWKRKPLPTPSALSREALKCLHEAGAILTLTVQARLRDVQ